MGMPRTAIITGIAGQDGSFLAELLCTKGYRVVGLVRPGARDQNDGLQGIRDRIELVEADIMDQARVKAVIEEYRPSEIYNFAARASSLHLTSEPQLTGEINGLVVLRLLELIRTIDPTIRFCQASSSEMFGNAVETPQSETTPFRPRNAYGVAKLFAHGMVGAYRANSGVFACSGILFNHESPRRGPEFVTRRISTGVARISLGLDTHLKLGSLDAVRDWGYAADYARGMWMMLQADSPEDYVLATGVSHVVRDFCDIAFRHVGLDYRNHVELDPSAQRPPETVILVGNSSKARTSLGWSHTVSFEELVHMMVDADIRRFASTARTHN